MRCRYIAYLVMLFLTPLISACTTLYGVDVAPASEKIQMQNTYTLMPGQDVIGQVYRTRVGFHDNIYKIAKRYDIGYAELKAANPRVNFIFPGESLIIPKEYVLPPKAYRHGIVINVPELRLYYFGKDNTVSTYPVSLGREGWRTPLGKTYVYRKQKDPTWWIPKSIREAREHNTGKESPRKIPPGPDNPLGTYAIYLAKNGYLIHGTNNSNSIGLPVSAGCIRMYNEDVGDLFTKVKRGTSVNIIYYPVKAGFRDNKLFLEVHRGIKNADDHYRDEELSPSEIIEQALNQHPYNIDWQRVARIVTQHLGIPAIAS